jgi:sulfatase maturation enzyme AslB (radical SAM superfamily)
MGKNFKNYMSNTHKLCLYPFTNLTVNPTGTVSPCCKYNLNKADTAIDQETLYDKTIEELFFQPAMNSLREQFINGEQPAACAACWDEESAGIKSMREHRMTLQHSRNHASKYKDKFEDPNIITLDFKFSSLCNLKCRICGPYCSSTWLKESQDTGNFHEHTIKIFSKYAERKFINKPENFEIFKKLLPNLHIVEFYGGEPLMQPEHKIIMNIIKEYVDKQPIGLELFYNTNGTHYDEDAVEVWKKLYAVEINISLDDIEDRFEYQRYPAKWNNVCENLIKYKALTGTFIRTSLYCTVSLYNIFYIDQLIKYNAENLKMLIRFNLLHWPPSMSIKNLPNNIKQVIANKIKALSVEDLKYLDNPGDLESMVNFMMTNPSNEKEYAEFLSTTKKHDDYRQQSFEHTFPEFWSLLNDGN